jgi:FixJ family two-component response regulator
MGADRISPKAFIQEEKTGRPHADRFPTRPVARLETVRPRVPLIGVKQPEIRFLHENSKSVPAGSNPSKRHRADRGMIAPSDQEPSKGRSTPGFARSRRSEAASPAAEGMSMVSSNGKRNNIVGALAHPAALTSKSATIDAPLARSSQDAVVFIIDDDVAVREALHSLLRDVRLQAEVFGSPAELLASELPDAASCLVLDIRLPGVSGFDFQTELARANINIPIIFMTGYADIPMAVRAMKAGAVDFLTKPFREQDLLDAVATAIARDRMRRESEKVASQMRARFETLSPREREVMALVTSGLMNKQVAAKTGLAEPTVKMHRGQAMRKMGAKSVADLVKMAEILEMHGNSFRHPPSSELEVASGACASDPRPGKTAHGLIGDFATPDSRHAMLAAQVLKQQPWNPRRLQRVEPMRGGGPYKSQSMAIAAISSATK